MAWEVEYTDEFEAWWNGLTEEEQVELGAKVHLLERDEKKREEKKRGKEFP